MDLELVSTDDLITELEKRAEALVLSMYTPRANEINIHYDATKGNYFTCLGLCTDLCAQLAKNALDTMP